MDSKGSINARGLPKSLPQGSETPVRHPPAAHARAPVKAAAWEERLKRMLAGPVTFFSQWLMSKCDVHLVKQILILSLLPCEYRLWQGVQCAFSLGCHSQFLSISESTSASLSPVTFRWHRRWLEGARQSELMLGPEVSRVLFCSAGSPAGP